MSKAVPARGLAFLNDTLSGGISRCTTDTFLGFALFTGIKKGSRGMYMVTALMAWKPVLAARGSLYVVWVVPYILRRGAGLVYLFS